MGWVPVIAAIVSAIAVVTAAIFTAVQTNKRGLREKIWAAKSEVYADIFDALDVMAQWADLVSEDTRREFVITPEVERRKREEFEIATAVMRKAVVRRTGLLSAKVEQAVSVFFLELRQADAAGEWSSHVRQKTAAVLKARASLKRLVRKDLGLSSGGAGWRTWRSGEVARGALGGAEFIGTVQPMFNHGMSLPVSNGAAFVRRKRLMTDESPPS
ncbi:hypothetical protein [Caulobacter flavus]|jgi:hypothetical protein|nr:hypothetical protein [Caulobacter flavus]